ncbi:MAG: hypothetical protein K9J13_03260 [Saprospiraceae bacterium]|nr:hypothetical protein [Saprospiraceae bacterium]
MRYFLLILLSIILSKNSFSQESYAEEKIHWKIILPEDFQKTIIELNKDKELIKSIKVTEQYFKVDYSDYVDTSRVYFDTNGRISKIHLNDKRLTFYRRYVDSKGQYYRTYDYIMGQVPSFTISYNNIGLLSNLKVYLYNKSLNKNIFDYEYIISYKNDSNISKVIVKDSIKEIGKIELVYKDKKLIKENSFLGKKLLYNIQYHYILDSRKNDEIIKVTKTINGKTLCEKLYNSGEEILKIQKDGSDIQKLYKIPIGHKVDYKTSGYNYLSINSFKRILSELYPNPETNLSCYYSSFNNNDNLLSSYELYFNANPIYASGIKWIYTKDGLLKRKCTIKKMEEVKKLYKSTFINIRIINHMLKYHFHLYLY